MLSIIFTSINWNEVFFGSEDWGFLLEVILRTSIMFLVIIVGLKVLGKRSIKQLSVFELVVILSLGSAAGDPMIQKSAGILPSFIVFTVVILLYQFITFLISKSEAFERAMEEKPICLIREGRFDLTEFNKEMYGNQELLSEFRVYGISQLGQVEYVYSEMSGEFSVFFYEDKDVKFGLPLLPDKLKKKLTVIDKEGIYSCGHCGFTEFKSKGEANSCEKCNRIEWVESSNQKRIT